MAAALLGALVSLLCVNLVIQGFITIVVQGAQEFFFMWKQHPNSSPNLEPYSKRDSTSLSL